jgi:hypothetical protein
MDCADDDCGSAMNKDEGKLRSVLTSYFPMFIATLSLITSIFNGYLNNKFVDLIQRNLNRGESLRTCKEIIDSYFQVKFRVGIVSENGEQERKSGAPVAGAAAARVEALNAVNKIGALGTYLANMRDDLTRDRYTQLTTELEKIAKEAPEIAPAVLDARFAAADKLFDGLNSDCVHWAKD